MQCSRKFTLWTWSMLVFLTLLPEGSFAHNFNKDHKGNSKVCHDLTCPADGIYAHPTYCNEYVHCLAGKPYIKRCPSNLNFNAQRGTCDEPRASHCIPFKKSCELKERYVPQGPSDGEVTCDCEGTCTKAHPFRCNVFYHCDEKGVEHLTKCPGDLLFNAHIGQCDLPESAGCLPAPPCECDNCRFPASDKCSTYWQCESGRSVRHYCSRGLLFNQDTLQCDLAINVDCSLGAWDEDTFLEQTCVDRRGDCGQMVENGGCECYGDICDWQIFVLKNCPKSCGNCKFMNSLTKSKNRMRASSRGLGKRGWFDFFWKKKDKNTKPDVANNEKIRTTPKPTIADVANNEKVRTTPKPTKADVQTKSVTKGSKLTPSPFIPDSRDSANTEYIYPSATTSAVQSTAAKTTRYSHPPPLTSTIPTEIKTDGKGVESGSSEEDEKKWEGYQQKLDGCLINCTVGENLLHPYDCHKYLFCSPSGLEEISCPPCTQWVQGTFTCENESTSMCETGSYLTPEGQECGSGGKDEKRKEDGVIDGCIIDCSSGQYFSHPNDCRKFIHCTPYGPQEMPCGPGTIWVQKLLTCNHESNSVCKTGKYLTKDGKECGGGYIDENVSGEELDSEESTKEPKEPESESTEEPKEPENENTQEPKVPENESTEEPKEPESESTEEPKEQENESTEAPKEPESESNEEPEESGRESSEETKESESQSSEETKESESKSSEETKESESGSIEESEEVEECADEVPDCIFWAANNDCVCKPTDGDCSWQKYVASSCPKSCGMCGEEPKKEENTCKDEEFDCKFWAANNDCICKPTDGDCSWQNYVAYTCPMSCGNCVDEGDRSDVTESISKEIDVTTIAKEEGTVEQESGEKGEESESSDVTESSSDATDSISGEIDESTIAEEETVEQESSEENEDNVTEDSTGVTESSTEEIDTTIAEETETVTEESSEENEDNVTEDSTVVTESSTEEIDTAIAEETETVTEESIREEIDTTTIADEEETSSDATESIREEIDTTTISEEEGNSVEDKSNEIKGDIIDGCAINCTLGKYFPHPSDCHKFIECSPSGPEEMPCAPGTVWVQSLLTCDYESNSKCETGSYLTPDGKRCGGGNYIDGCVINCTLGKYFPHPSDCHKFIQCAPYGPQEMPCANGTVWVQSKLTCDHESISKCVTGTYLTPEGKTCGSGGEGEREKCELNCPTPNGIFPHPRDCTKFLDCQKNQPYIKDCPPTLFFSPKARACDWPENAKCIATADAPCIVPEPIVPTPFPDQKPDICDCECCIRPHPEDCTSYYYCEPGAKAEFHTCSDGLVFNPNLGQCVPQATYPECQPEKPPTCDPSCECLYPAETCSEYYKCNGDGVPIKKECLGGLYYNDEKHSCDFPENVSCSPLIPIISPRGYKATLAKAHYIKPEDCKNLQGFFAIKGDPTSYYLCSRGNAFVLKCPEKGIFSSTHDRCILRK